MPAKAMLREAPRSIFDGVDYGQAVSSVLDEATELYLSDDTPWVVGYSGGKDSTAVLQIVWMMIEKLGPNRAKKPVHVITTDTMVENPIVSAWVESSIRRINSLAGKLGLPIKSHLLRPAIEDSYWVNLIGRGYAAPRQKFRWCTVRLKINPSHKFISETVNTYGNAILVLGTRKAESAARARSMAKHEAGRVRDKLSPNASLPNSMIYSPIENWANDDVWMFLLETENPWGHDNNDLFALYKGASKDGECPLVVSTNTPSCGDSRFGCWVCTLVEKDKSMQAMLRNDQDKQWMQPLVEMRGMLDFRSMSDGDRKHRDFRRMNGRVDIFHDAPIPGPYLKEYREALLRRLLEAQKEVRAKGPESIRDIELIRIAELEEIRRIWVVDKHEIEDSLPNIYEQATGLPYPGTNSSTSIPFSSTALEKLRQQCGSDFMRYELLRELLSIATKRKISLRRKNVFAELEAAIKKHYYSDYEDAVDQARIRSKGTAAQSDNDAASENTIWIASK